MLSIFQIICNPVFKKKKVKIFDRQVKSRGSFQQREENIELLDKSEMLNIEGYHGNGEIFKMHRNCNNYVNRIFSSMLGE